MEGRIIKVETFGTVDGPGIRYVVFLQDCPLRCLYCHNPESWSKNGEEPLKMTSDQIVKEVKKYKAYHRNEGNITISGGEPLMQIDFVIELVTKCKEQGIHVTIDTSGSTFINSEKYVAKIKILADMVDLWMIDLKHIDNKKHQHITGKPNTNIIEFIKLIDEIGKEIWIKYVLVPGYSDDVNDLKNTRKFLDALKKLTKVEVLPFHKAGEFKYKELGEDYFLTDVFEPKRELVELAEEILIKK